MTRCVHGLASGTPCIVCAIEKQTAYLSATILEAVDLLRRDLAEPDPVIETAPPTAPAPKPEPLVPPTNEDPAQPPATKAEMFFMKSHDAFMNQNGELFTAAYGRWIRTQ